MYTKTQCCSHHWLIDLYPTAYSYLQPYFAYIQFYFYCMSHVIIVHHYFTKCNYSCIPCFAVDDPRLVHSWTVHVICHCCVFSVWLPQYTVHPSMLLIMPETHRHILHLCKQTSAPCFMLHLQVQRITNSRCTTFYTVICLTISAVSAGQFMPQFIELVSLHRFFFMKPAISERENNPGQFTQPYGNMPRKDWF